MTERQKEEEGRHEKNYQRDTSEPGQTGTEEQHRQAKELDERLGDAHMSDDPHAGRSPGLPEK